MKTVNRKYNHAAYAVPNRYSKPRHRWLSQMAILAMCSVLLIPGIASAKKPVASEAGCVIPPPAYIDTGFPYIVKIVRDPSYTGVWSQPTVEVTAVFTMADGGQSVDTHSETISKYGVTYVNVPMLAPNDCELDGSSCGLVNSGEDAVISAVVREPINKGKRFRETVCTPAKVSVNSAM